MRRRTQPEAPSDKVEREEKQKTEAELEIGREGIGGQGTVWKSYHSQKVGVLLFKGGKNPLSNLYPIEQPFEHKGNRYISSENAYQWEKAIVHGESEKAKRIVKATPWKALCIGQSIPTGKRWQINKYRVMTEIVLKKCDKSKSYRDYLMSSTTATLVENTSHPYWGRGRHNTGKNILGVIHSEIRESLLRQRKS